MNSVNEHDLGLDTWAWVPFLESRRPESGFSAAVPPPLCLYEPSFARPLDLIEDPGSYRNLVPDWRRDSRLPSEAGPGYPGGKVDALSTRFQGLPLLEAVALGDAAAVQRAIEAVQAAPATAVDNLEQETFFWFGDQAQTSTAGLAHPATGETALHVAAACARPDLVAILLESGLYEADIRDRPGSLTPLMYLAWHSAEPCATGRISEDAVAQCAELLLQHGADLDAVSFQDEGADLAKGSIVTTAVGWACRAWNAAFLQALRGRGHDFASMPDEDQHGAESAALGATQAVLERYLRSSDWGQQDARVHQALGAERDRTMRTPRSRSQPQRLYLRHTLTAFGVAFGPNGAEPPAGLDGDIAPDDDDDKTNYAWDFSGSRLVSGPGGCTSNSVWARFSFWRWKATVDELIAGGAKVAPMRDLVAPTLTHVPAEAALHLFDHLARANGTYPAPSALLLPILTLSDARGSLPAMLVLARPWSLDLPQLLQGLAGRGIDFSDPAHSFLWPCSSGGLGPLRLLNRSAARKQLGGLPSKMADDERHAVELAPVPTFALAIASGREQLARWLLELGASQTGRRLLPPGRAWSHYLEPSSTVLGVASVAEAWHSSISGSHWRSRDDLLQLQWASDLGWASIATEADAKALEALVAQAQLDVSERPSHCNSNRT